MNDTPLSAVQPALLRESPPCAVSMEWDLRGNPAALWAALATLEMDGASLVVGLGAPLLSAGGASVPGYWPLEHLSHGRYTLPATPHALWTLVGAATPGAVFEAADALRSRWQDNAVLVECTTLFSYRQGRDLTGYADGSANPQGDDAWAAALVQEGEWQGATFALVQRWLHFRDRFAAQTQAQRDAVIGRTEQDDEEMDDAPPSAHIKRTEQEDFDTPAFVLRRSMPWGDMRRHGLQFIAYMNDLGKSDRLLRRMMGLEDGLQDALLAHSQAETGSYYLVPPIRAGRLHLPQTRFAELGGISAPPSSSGLVAQGGAVHNVIHLHEHGPLELEGQFVVAGTPLTQALLCRCGASSRKPYCDGSHTARGFAAPDPAQADPLPACTSCSAAGVPPTGGVLVQPVADGPLVLQGTVELRPAPACARAQQSGATLCRCGHSANKPFCDGSHSQAGFAAGA